MTTPLPPVGPNPQVQAAHFANAPARVRAGERINATAGQSPVQLDHSNLFQDQVHTYLFSDTDISKIKGLSDEQKDTIAFMRQAIRGGAQPKAVIGISNHNLEKSHLESGQNVMEANIRVRVEVNGRHIEFSGPIGLNYGHMGEGFIKSHPMPPRGMRSPNAIAKDIKHYMGGAYTPQQKQVNITKLKKELAVVHKIQEAYIAQVVSLLSQGLESKPEMLKSQVRFPGSFSEQEQNYEANGTIILSDQYGEKHTVDEKQLGLFHTYMEQCQAGGALEGTIDSSQISSRHQRHPGLAAAAKDKSLHEFFQFDPNPQDTATHMITSAYTEQEGLTSHSQTYAERRDACGSLMDDYFTLEQELVLLDKDIEKGTGDVAAKRGERLNKIDEMEAKLQEISARAEDFSRDKDKVESLIDQQLELSTAISTLAIHQLEQAKPPEGLMGRVQGLTQKLAPRKLLEKHQALELDEITIQGRATIRSLKTSANRYTRMQQLLDDPTSLEDTAPSSIVEAKTSSKMRRQEHTSLSSKLDEIVEEMASTPNPTRQDIAAYKAQLAAIRQEGEIVDTRSQTWEQDPELIASKRADKQSSDDEVIALGFKRSQFQSFLKKTGLRNLWKYGKSKVANFHLGTAMGRLHREYDRATQALRKLELEVEGGARADQGFEPQAQRVWAAQQFFDDALVNYDGNHPPDVRAERTELNQALNSLGEAIYAAPQAGDLSAEIAHLQVELTNLEDELKAIQDIAADHRNLFQRAKNAALTGATDVDNPVGIMKEEEMKFHRAKGAEKNLQKQIQSMKKELAIKQEQDRVSTPGADPIADGTRALDYNTKYLRQADGYFASDLPNEFFFDLYILKTKESQTEPRSLKDCLELRDGYKAHLHQADTVYPMLDISEKLEARYNFSARLEIEINKAKAPIIARYRALQAKALDALYKRPPIDVAKYPYIQDHTMDINTALAGTAQRLLELLPEFMDDGGGLSDDQIDELIKATTTDPDSRIDQIPDSQTQAYVRAIAQVILPKVIKGVVRSSQS
jgi:hypothetical protein